MIVDILTEYIDEGIQVVDRDGVTVIYNDKMSSLEETKRDNVLGMPFEDAYPGFPVDNSTLMKALRTGKPTLNKEQTYLNQFGKTVNTINTTIPVEKDGEVIAAIEIARDITTLTEMSNKIIDYQIERNENKSKIVTDKTNIRKYTFNDLIGEDKEFKACVENAKLIAKNSFSVLILGETGTGKELFSQSIHYGSDRKNKPFLAQNCAALPESLLEGILFGTVKGGFTGAVDRPGLFEQASGGTLLLDEITALPYTLQSKLLRVLQENYIRRVGGVKDIPVDVRIIATANESIEELISKELFRKDLYYRLGTITLNILPLRERRKDIPILANYFIRKHQNKIGGEIIGISTGAIEKLKSYDFPGNVRELENIIIAAMASADGDELLREKHIAFTCKNNYRDDSNNLILKDESLAEMLGSIEYRIIDRTLKECDGNIAQAAQRLGMKRQNLQYKIKKYDIR